MRALVLAGLLISLVLAVPLPLDSIDGVPKIQHRGAEGEQPGNGRHRAGVFPGYYDMPVNETALLEAGYEPQPDPALGIVFDAVCRYVSLTGTGYMGRTTLNAECIDSTGTWWDTSLNLNECVTNMDGRLAYADDGLFDHTCRRCIVVKLEDKEGLQLKCSCDGYDGSSYYTWLPLGTHVDHPRAVKAVSGQLVCGDRKGTKAPSFS